MGSFGLCTRSKFFGETGPIDGAGWALCEFFLPQLTVGRVRIAADLRQKSPPIGADPTVEYLREMLHSGLKSAVNLRKCGGLTSAIDLKLALKLHRSPFGKSPDLFE